MPDLPAIGEAVPGYSTTTWFAMWAPAGTPKEIINRLNQSITRYAQHPDIASRLRADGMEPAASTPEEFSRFIGEEIAKWSKVVKAGNIKVDYTTVPRCGTPCPAIAQGAHCAPFTT